MSNEARPTAENGTESTGDPGGVGPCPQHGRTDFTYIGGVYISESYYLECVRHVTSLIPSKAAFGPFTIDDLKSEASLWCIKALPFWDSSRCLKNFLYRHVQNRLINFRRDNLIRNDPPCKLCHVGKYCGEPADESTRVCAKYQSWALRNSAKHCLAQAGVACEPLTSSYQAREKPILEELEKKELFELFDDKIPLHLRSLYLKAKEGGKLTQKQYQLVVTELRSIMGLAENPAGNPAEGESQSEESGEELSEGPCDE